MTPSAQQLSQMICGYWISQMIHVAARLRLADELHAGPRTVTALAETVAAHPRSLGRLLRGLASVGLFEETPPGTYQLTPLAEFLRDDHPQSVRPMALMMGGVQYQAWGELLHAVRTGETGFAQRFGQPLFDYLATRPDEAAEFDRAMVAIHGREGAAVAEAYDFARVRRVVDVGGGNGHQLIELLDRHPHLTGTLFDLPHVVERAAPGLAASRVAARIDPLGGSFFETVPTGADCYLLRHILHDWSDEESARILRTIRHAIPTSGKLLVIETVIPPGNEPNFAKLLDLTMLVIPGGIERTEAEYRELFAAGGFRLTRILPTAAGVDLIEGVPV